MVNCDRCQLPRIEGCTGEDLRMVVDTICPNFERWHTLAAMLRRWPIPKRYEAARLGDTPAHARPDALAGLRMAHEAVAKAVEAIRSGKGGSIIITGPVYGAGKSHLAASAARRANDLGLTAAWTDAHSLIERLKAAQFDDSDPLRDLNRVDLLIVDDISKARSTDFSDSALWSLFNARYVAGKHALVTTNLSAAELRVNHSWGAIIDRLNEQATVIRFDAGESLRRPSNVVTVGRGE